MKPLVSELIAMIVAAVSVCVHSTTAADGRRETQNSIHSKWTREEEFRRFDSASIRIRRKSRMKALSESASTRGGFSVDIEAFNRTFSIDLVQNKYLISSSYIEKSIDRFGSVEYHGNASSTNKTCYFIGQVSNESDSVVAVSTCSGGVSAQILSGNDLFSIEPDDNSMEGRHTAYRQSDSQIPEMFCGQHYNISHSFKEFRRRKKRASLKWPQDSFGTTKLVELYIVNDVSQYQTYGSDINSVNSRTKSLVNFASGLYQQLNVYISLVGVETWTSSNQITVNFGNSSQTLQNFASYRRTKINPRHRNDNAQLLSSSRYLNSVIGLAYVDAMCTVPQSAAIISDISSTVGYTATTMAHEMGHSFGMQHDNELPYACSCEESTGKCIMSSVASNPPSTHWSQCSKDVLTDFLASASSYCLNDFNGVLFDPSSVCGNGIVETGEQCDCGKAPSSECNSACCSASTCKLISNAECAAGKCCDIGACLLKSESTLCRPANSSCDLAEYCSGDDNLCPSDVYVHDGTSCTAGGVAAFCYNGLCRSHSTQCKLLWGSNINKSIDECYSEFNVLGTTDGNCGNATAAGSLKKCSPDDVLCGTLQCDVRITNFKSQFQLDVPADGYPNTRTNSPTNIDSTTFCTALNYNNGDPYYPSPGYVPNGAVCGESKMCVDKTCVPVTDIVSRAACPSCNQNGVCNSLGQCHCNVGYAPPNCTLPGRGGSYHSNSILPTNVTRNSTRTTPTSTLSPSTTTAREESSQAVSTTVIIVVSVLGGTLLIVIIFIVIIIATRQAVTPVAASAAAAATVSARPRVSVASVSVTVPGPSTKASQLSFHSSQKYRERPGHQNYGYNPTFFQY